MVLAFQDYFPTKRRVLTFISNKNSSIGISLEDKIITFDFWKFVETTNTKNIQDLLYEYKTLTLPPEEIFICVTSNTDGISL